MGPLHPQNGPGPKICAGPDPKPRRIVGGEVPEHKHHRQQQVSHTLLRCVKQTVDVQLQSGAVTHLTVTEPFRGSLRCPQW